MGRPRKHLHTPEQTALRGEFAKLYELSGWNQVQCATQLNMTQGYVSKILNNEVAIEPATISHFKLRLAAGNPNVANVFPLAERKTARQSEGQGPSASTASYGEEKRDEIAELKESFAALVRSEPEKALSLTGVISYLRWGKKKRSKTK